jgi:hypothetical protein
VWQGEVLVTIVEFKKNEKEFTYLSMFHMMSLL